MGSATTESAESAPQGAAEPWPNARRAWYTVVLLALVSTMSNIDRGVVNLLVESIKRDMLLSDTQISLLIGFAFSFFYMICGLPMARVADSYSRKIILTTGLTIWSAATALCGLAQTFWQLFAARGIVGAGESVKGPCSMSMITDLVPREKLPRAFAIYQMGITAGMAGSMIIGGVLIGLLANMPPIELPANLVIRDWHMVFLICGFPGLALALLMVFTVREPARRGRKDKKAVPIKEIVRYLGLRVRIYLPLLLSIAIGSIESFGLAVWRPAFFERTYGWGPAIVGPILGIIMLIAVPIGLALGTALAEYYIRRKRDDAMLRVCFISQILSVPLAVATPLMPTPILALAVGMASTIAGAMSAPGQNSAIQIITPNAMRGQVTAIYLFTISVIGGGFGPTAIALITDNVFADPAMLRYAMAAFAAIVGPIGALLLWITLKPYAAVIRNMPQT